MATKPKMTNVGPTPTRFSVGEGQLGMISAATMATVMRAGAGTFCYGYEASIPQDDGNTAVYSIGGVAGRKLKETSSVSSFPRPAVPLELYEFEGCPFCKKVREAICILDVDVYMFPTPRGNSEIYRRKIIAEGGKAQFPYLKDPNTGKAMYESDDIIRYLFDTYGPGQANIPRSLTLGFLTTLTAGLGLAPRLGAGSRSSPSTPPALPLTFWGYEGSPFVKVAREVLCELQIPYLWKTTARGSPKRQEVLDNYGTFQVPLLEDPNPTEEHPNGVYLFESGAIRKYLYKTYGVKTDPVAAQN